MKYRSPKRSLYKMSLYIMFLYKILIRQKKTLFRKSSPLILTPDWNEQLMSFGYVSGYEIEREIDSNFDLIKFVSTNFKVSIKKWPLDSKFVECEFCECHEYSRTRFRRVLCWCCDSPDSTTFAKPCCTDSPDSRKTSLASFMEI